MAHDERFAKVLLHVRSDFMDIGLDTTAFKGGKAFEALLITIGEPEPDPHLELPSPGLIHDLDAPRMERERSEQQQSTA